MSGRIVWLSSYPKSGNTWLRALLTNYRRGASEPADINALDGGDIASSRALFDIATGIEASDLTAGEILQCRPWVYRSVSAAGPDLVFMKVHDTFAIGPDGPLFPSEATAVALYILRNPLDIAPSLARHMAVSVDVAITRMNLGHTLSPTQGSLGEQLEQSLGSWSEHVCSWIDQTYLPTHTVRYEDLLDRPEETFAGVVNALGLSLSVATVARAVELSAFDRLARQEHDRGFQERSASGATFFLHGRAGVWRDALTKQQTLRIVEAHGDTMRRFGYLNAAGEPI